MMNKIIAAALRGRAAVLAIALFVLGYGLWTAARMPIDVLPDLNRPVVTILTEAHGMVPEAVELQVTRPIERAVNGTTGVYRVRSSSAAGFSVVWVEFDWSSEIYRCRQVVSEKLQLVSPELPEGVDPVMAPISSIMGQIQVVGFRTDPKKMRATDLRYLIDRDVKPRIQSIPGVAQVVTVGGQPTELQVTVDAEKLRTFDVTLHDVEQAVLHANVSTAGGNLTVGVKSPRVAVSGLIKGAGQLEKALVREDGTRPVRIEDVAEVAPGPASIGVGEAGMDGGPGVLMIVSKQPAVDTVSLTERIRNELSAIEKNLPKEVGVVPDVFEQAAFIHRAVDNVRDAVKDGAILVVIILFLFLLNFRTTLITLAAIPLSVSCAALVFNLFGLTINTMTLGGLAVAIGTLVDDAIVDVENVFRRLHENARRERRRSVLRVVFEASSEIRRPVMYGTLLVTVVYLPLFFLGGIEGRLFTPIGVAYIVSVFASLLVALTVTPVLCYYLLGGRRATGRDYGGWLVRLIHGGVSRLIRFSVAYPLHVLGVVLALFACCTAIFLAQGSAFLPEFNEGSYQVNLILEPDASLEVSDAFGRRLERTLVGIKGVQHVGRRTGRAEGDEHAMPVSISEAIVTVDATSGRNRADLLREIRDRVEAEFPGVIHATEQPLKHLLDHLLSGVTASVAIKVSGDDLDVLRGTAKKIEASIRGIAGVRDLYVEPQVLIDQVSVEPKREALALLGYNVRQVAETVELAMGGKEVSRFQVGQVTTPIVVRLEKSDRGSIEKLKSLYVRKPGGELVLLSDVADVVSVKSPNEIKREHGRRRVVVQHNVEGRALSDVVADVKRALEPIQKELARESGSYAVHVGGQFEAQEEASRTIAIMSILSAGFMLLILYLHFGSVRLAWLVLLSRPIAFIGAVIAIVVTGQDISIATLVGMIALLGVSARNAILLVDHYLHLMRVERVPFGIPLLVRAGQERAIPILMTALTSGIGLVPLALEPSQPGRELLYPVATVIIGGLVSSTFLDFLVTPGLFVAFGGREAQRIVQDAEATETFERPLIDEPVSAGGRPTR